MSNARLTTIIIGAVSIIVGLTVTTHAFVGLLVAFLYWQLYGRSHDV